eukprot:711954-Prymnesium_polylepis.1
MDALTIATPSRAPSSPARVRWSSSSERCAREGSEHGSNQAVHTVRAKGPIAGQRGLNTAQSGCVHGARKGTNRRAEGFEYGSIRLCAWCAQGDSTNGRPGSSVGRMHLAHNGLARGAHF